MSDAAPPLPAARGPLLQRLAGSRRFQRWAARFPLTRPFVRREGEAMFDLVAGFCHSQVLQALILFRIPDRLADGPTGTAGLAAAVDVPEARMDILLRAGAALGLLKGNSRAWRLTTRGAALAAVPGLPEMIRHHAVLYRDLADPAAFFRGTAETELARFWPYVFGAGAAEDPAAAARWSRLMADSQALVAEDTLATIDLSRTRHLMDVGGGTGAFLSAVHAAVPRLQLTLFDLPAVLEGARSRLDAVPVRFAPGSFRDDPLPGGADAISLVRVLYDHSDETVAALLGRVREALPPGGRVIVSEPMTGGDSPSRAGDAYFALYCMAMQTGQARSRRRIADLLRAAGFTRIRMPAPRRPFVTSVVTAVNPD